MNCYLGRRGFFCFRFFFLFLSPPLCSRVTNFVSILLLLFGLLMQPADWLFLSTQLSSFSSAVRGMKCALMSPSCCFSARVLLLLLSLLWSIARLHQFVFFVCSAQGAFLSYLRYQDNPDLPNFDLTVIVGVGSRICVPVSSTQDWYLICTTLSSEFCGYLGEARFAYSLC